MTEVTAFRPLAHKTLAECTNSDTLELENVHKVFLHNMKKGRNTFSKLLGHNYVLIWVHTRNS